jgi:hypothetical protein
MIIQSLIEIVNQKQPSSINVFLECAGVIGVVGFLLWLMGARYSRQIVTLCGVAIGTLVGKHLPEIAPRVNLAPAVLAVGGALLLGVTAFLTHRLWVGVLLGSMLAVWTSLGTWIAFRGQQSWSQPVWDADMSLRQFSTGLWSVLPPDVTRVLPWAAGAAMVSGLAMALLWPRIAAALNWSIAGASMWLMVALAALCFVKPDLLGRLPTQTPMQIAALAAIVLFGTGVQWKLSRPARTKAAPRPATAAA